MRERQLLLSMRKELRLIDLKEKLDLKLLEQRLRESKMKEKRNLNCID